MTDHSIRRLIIATAASASLALTACGTEDEELPNTSDASDSGDAGGEDDTTAPDACTADTCASVADATVDVDDSVDILPGCTEPDPRGCLALGCEPGFECVPSDTDGCVPSVCSCDAESDSWMCTADCGQPHVCAPASPTCPDDVPIGDSCGDLPDETFCAYGTEGCCGDIYNSTECTCSGGEWACLATDACFIESCAGRPCENNADCSGGGTQTICFEGVCEQADICSTILFREGCNDVELCQWQAPGCSDSTVEEGCYPIDDCNADFGCPAGFTCRLDTPVLPQCAYPADDGTACDACSVTRNLCVPDPAGE